MDMGRIEQFRVQCIVTGKIGELAIDQIRTVDKTRLNTSNSFGRLSDSEITHSPELRCHIFSLHIQFIHIYFIITLYIKSFKIINIM